MGAAGPGPDLEALMAQVNSNALGVNRRVRGGRKKSTHTLSRIPSQSNFLSKVCVNLHTVLFIRIFYKNLEAQKGGNF